MIWEVLGYFCEVVSILLLVVAPAIIFLVSVSHLLHDHAREFSRRLKEPDVETEVNHRLASGLASDVVIAHPVVPIEQLQNSEELSDTDTDLRRFGPRNLIITFGLCIIAFIVFLRLVASTHSKGYGAVAILIWAAVVIVTVLAVQAIPTSRATMVRYRVRIAHMAAAHDAQFIAETHPGDGWDLTGFTDLVNRASLDWDTLDIAVPGEQYGWIARPRLTYPITILEEPTDTVVRLATGPSCEWGHTSFSYASSRRTDDRSFTYFYILSAVPPGPELCLRYREYLPWSQRLRMHHDGGNPARLYEARHSGEAAFSALSGRTLQLMVSTRVDKMVIGHGWAILWWEYRRGDGQIPHFGGSQQWPGDTIMTDPRTWEKVDTARTLLTHLTDDLSRL